MCNMIKQKYPSLEEEVGFYVGGMKKDQLKSASEKSLIFATFEMEKPAEDIRINNTIQSNWKKNRANR